MEKVKLTRGQAKAIEDIKGTMHLNLEANLRVQIKKEWYGYPFGSLNKLTTKEFLDALYIGYEVEPIFEVGEWVKVNWRDKKPSIHMVIKVNKSFVIIDGEQENTKPPVRIIEHATTEEIAKEKERRWWAKHGREVWELRENDLLYYDDEFEEVEEVSEFGAIMLSSERVYFPIKTISGKFSVACFAEDRKDVKP